MRKKLVCNMLGSTSFFYDGQEFSIKCHETSKVMQLFLMLLYAGDEGIAKVKLLENLYEHDEIQDTKNALRILIFRLKKLLQATNLPEDDYITTRKGVCYFGGQVEILVDAREFERSAREALAVSDGKERVEALEKVCGSYTGEFLVQLATETWVLLENLRYKELYFQCVREACDLLKAGGRHEERLGICSRAAELYPFEEWQEMKIDCLMAMNRYKEAMKIYEETTRLYFEELHLQPSAKMLEQFRMMSRRIHFETGDLNNIQDGLQEPEWKGGAYYFSYPSFVDGYRLVARIMERAGMSVFLMLCTLTDSAGDPLGKEELLKEEMEKLCVSIEESLRRGDSYTRSGLNQTLILLVGVNRENCEIIYNRIYQNYKKRSSGRRVELSYHVASVLDLERSGYDITQGGWWL